MAGDLHMALSRLARMDPPVIAAVNGAAGGAGFSIVMAADLAIAAQSAKFTMAYTNAGLSPDGSSTFYMPRKIGDRRARELMLTNRVLSAAEALDWGVVNQVVADGEALAAAMTLAKRLAAGPTRAYGAVKTLLNESFEHGLESQMELEARKIAELVVSADGQEGIKAFFEKRKPGYTGR
jgi:2-(1,2-epoxy-1,2-dihydrophenyl)acetyl-CoA isomerase